MLTIFMIAILIQPSIIRFVFRRSHTSAHIQRLHDTSEVAFTSPCLFHSHHTTSRSSSLHFNRLLMQLDRAQRVSSKDSLYQLIITPFTPLLMCDHHYRISDLPLHHSVRLHPLYSYTTHLIKPFDIICIETSELSAFYSEILPFLTVRVILFTHKWNLPSVTRSNMTDLLHIHPKIAHWISQNPIYPSSSTYSAFPYGIDESGIQAYAATLLGNCLNKTVTIKTLYLQITHDYRQVIPPSPKLPIIDFYNEIAKSKYLLSPAGDRSDCYRHWECIGLGTIPISNIDHVLYSPLFGHNMVFVPNTTDMLPLLSNASKLEAWYKLPDRHLVSTLYWSEKIYTLKNRLANRSKLKS